MRARSYVGITSLLLTLALSACGEDPPTPGLSKAEQAVLGTWKIDVESFESSFRRMVENQLVESVRGGTLGAREAEDMRARLQVQLREQFANLWGKFVFTDDHAFAGDGTDGATSGHWSLEASRLSMTHTHEKGIEVAQPDTWYGTLRGDTLTMRPEPEKDYELTLVRIVDEPAAD